MVFPKVIPLSSVHPININEESHFQDMKGQALLLSGDKIFPSSEIVL